jgi:Concanavalin A-like lectin/glucanases superfamily
LLVTRSGPLAWTVSGLLLAAACAVFVWEPLHGPIVLSLAQGHGIDAGDLPALPLIAVAAALGQTRARHALAWPKAAIGRRTRAVCAIVLGAVLLAGVINTPDDATLMPAGGGTFGGRTLHADGRQAEPVNRWSHVAVTYDGAKLRLYFDGAKTSSRAATGTILRSTSPLWIGGNRPYGEYFHGVIDEVRVYNRALTPSAVRTEMATPIPRHGTSPAGGLVGAYAFDTGSGSRAADASGNGNTGAIRGPTWTARGRFGTALRFDGLGEVVRVPGSASLNLRGAMTLAAWIRPSKTQTGWRTILHRQTDAYFLTAGRGLVQEDRLGVLNYARVAVLIVVAAWLLVTVAGASPPWGVGRGHTSWPPVALFLAGSVVDAALVPTTALIGPTLVAMWYALIASDRLEAASLGFLAAVFTGVAAISFVGRGGPALAFEDGGVARSAALGLLLVVVGLLANRREFTGWRAMDAGTG